MTVGQALHRGQTTLQQAQIDSARLDTLLLLEKVIGKPRSWLEAHPEAALSTPHERDFVQFIQRRAQRIPLVHLTHRREFYGLDFYVDERVLTPRIETETMVGYVIKYAPKNSRLIDIGTGCGALAVAIKKHRTDLEVWASDVSENELAVARRNAKEHKVDVHFAVSNLLDDVTGDFDTVVTNLPYLRTDAALMPEVRHEPSVALYGGDDGLKLYRQLFKQLPPRLKPGGYLFTESDPWQHETLIELAANINLRPIEQADYFVLGFQQSA